MYDTSTYFVLFIKQSHLLVVCEIDIVWHITCYIVSHYVLSVIMQLLTKVKVILYFVHYCTCGILTTFMLCE